MTGIYKITSPSEKVYIGQAVNIEKRKKNYSKLRCKKQPRLYNSLLKYGFSEHIFEVIEECSIEDLNTRERHWQDFYDVLGKSGLNCRLTGTEDKSGKLSQHQIDKISQRKSKEVLQYTLEGVFMKKWKSTKEAAKSLGIPQGDISSCCLGKFRKAGGFIWTYPTSETPTQRIIRDLTKGKEVLQYSLEGVLLGEWKTIKTASEEIGLSSNNIVACCKGRSMSAGGFIWRYKVGTIEPKIEVGKVGKTSGVLKRLKPVEQYTVDGTLIRKWMSIKEPGMKLNIHDSCISACLAGKQKTAGGFIWKYKKNN
jgi:hypothetical protein